MLQQTQVKTVIPYWERWMTQLPTPAHLAEAPLETVLKLWEGLGYYSRARNLQRAAQQIQQQHEGRFPRQYEDILALPGVGPYTAGAVSSLAFNHAQPILDGNVTRVLSRLDAISGDVRDRAVSAQLWARARQLVEVAHTLPLPEGAAHSALFAGSCSILNQALMELGAIQCTPRTPDCTHCPVRNECRARLLNAVEAFPQTPPRPTSTPRFQHAWILERRGKLLLFQRKAGVVNGGLWEFPNEEVRHPRASAKELASMLGQDFGIVVGKGVLVAEIKHSITRYRIQLKGWSVPASESAPGWDPAAWPVPTRLTGDWAQARWVAWSEASQLAFPSAHRKLLSEALRLQKPKRARRAIDDSNQAL